MALARRESEGASRLKRRRKPSAGVARAVPFPDFDPVLVQLGPFAIRWYALAYVAGILLGWRYVRRPGAQPEALGAPRRRPRPRRRSTT